MNTTTNNPNEEVYSEVYGLEGIDAFMQLARFIAICEKEKPTLDTVDKALGQFQLMYGAVGEEELLNNGSADEIKIYHELKTVLNRLL